jgi:hypothetical protein
MGEDAVKAAIRKKRIPARPLAIATAPAYDPTLKQTMATEITSELVAKAMGKRVITTVGRKVPIVGGVVGAAADGYGTWQVGRYADRELVARGRR